PDMNGTPDMYSLMKEVFANPLYDIIYLIGVFALGYHLMHGFQSAWRSLGIMHRKYTPVLQAIGLAFSFLVTLGFAIIPVFFFFFKLEEISRSVILLDALFLFTTLTASRLAFRLFRQLLPYQSQPNSRKVLIYGAGDGGEMVLREIYNNPKLNYLPVGFVDDDPMKQGKTINGLKIFGSNGDLSKICEEIGVQEIVISCKELKPENLRRVKDFCRETGIILKKAELKIETIGFE
ncbi:MAG: hypothetical protein ACK419_06990, partial [Pyrinomonadaceae bacterium]